MDYRWEGVNTPPMGVHLKCMIGGGVHKITGVHGPPQGGVENTLIIVDHYHRNVMVLLLTILSIETQSEAVMGGAKCPSHSDHPPCRSPTHVHDSAMPSGASRYVDCNCITALINGI